MMACDVCSRNENVVTVGLTDWSYLTGYSLKTTVSEPCGDLCRECIGLVAAGWWHALDERSQQRIVQ